MNQYPEHEKLAKVKDKSQAAGDFLAWLRDEKKLILCREIDDELMPEFPQFEKLLGEFFEINLNVIEDEKRAMLAQLQHDRMRPRAVK